MKVVLVEGGYSSNSVSFAKFKYKLVYDRQRVHVRNLRQANAEEVVNQQLRVEIEVSMRASHVSAQNRETLEHSIGRLYLEEELSHKAFNSRKSRSEATPIQLILPNQLQIRGDGGRFVG